MMVKILLFLFLLCGSSCLCRSEGVEYPPYQSDDTIIGLSCDKFERTSDFCYPVSKEKELAWLAGHHFFLADSRDAKFLAGTGLTFNEPKSGSDRTVSETMMKEGVKDAIERERQAAPWIERHCVAKTSLYVYEHYIHRHRIGRFDIVGYCVAEDGVIINSFIVDSRRIK